MPQSGYDRYRKSTSGVIEKVLVGVLQRIHVRSCHSPRNKIPVRAIPKGKTLMMGTSGIGRRDSEPLQPDHVRLMRRHGSRGHGQTMATAGGGGIHCGSGTRVPSKMKTPSSARRRQLSWQCPHPRGERRARRPRVYAVGCLPSLAVTQPTARHHRRGQARRRRRPTDTSATSRYAPADTACNVDAASIAAGRSSTQGVPSSP